MIDKLLKDIGKNIKTIRLDKGLSQSALGKICHFEKASMSRIEAGKINITIKTLYIICNALEVRIIDIFPK